MPPGPTMVSKRVSGRASRSTSASRSRSRPVRGLRGRGSAQARAIGRGKQIVAHVVNQLFCIGRWIRVQFGAHHVGVFLIRAQRRPFAPLQCQRTDEISVGCFAPRIPAQPESGCFLGLVVFPAQVVVAHGLMKDVQNALAVMLALLNRPIFKWVGLAHGEAPQKFIPIEFKQRGVTGMAIGARTICPMGMAAHLGVQLIEAPCIHVNLGMLP